MIFYISNDHNRSLDATDTLHVSPNCWTLSPANRRAWEATPREIEASFTLCATCTPSVVGLERPATTDRIHTEVAAVAGAD
jgi:hypothetical protein